MDQWPEPLGYYRAPKWWQLRLRWRERRALRRLRRQFREVMDRSGHLFGRPVQGEDDGDD